MKTVQVLLSSFNGEKYIEEQLNSILNQDYSNIKILIRDDGSTDNTLKILERYSQKYSQIKYYCSLNIGVIQSFFDLMKQADVTADYFALSDQDDVWKSNKISKAIEMLEEYEAKDPLLYCGKTTLVNKDLYLLPTKIKTSRIRPSFENSLVENICTGCTSVINRQLLLIVQAHIPNFTVMHDWWLYLIASAFGKVIYDTKSYILYRQHDCNILGSKSSYYEEFKNRLKNYKKNRGNISRQAFEFQRLFQLDCDKQKTINYVVKVKKKVLYRFYIVFNHKIYRQRTLDNLIFKVLFLIGNI